MQFIDQSSSEGAIGLTGTKNGLKIRIKAKYRPRNPAALHDKQRRFGSRNSCVLIRTEFCSMLPV